MKTTGGWWQLKEEVEKLTAKERHVFDEILIMGKKYKNIFISQGLLAEKVGISRPYCNRVVKKLKEIGLLKTHYRHRHSCVYYINRMVFMDAYRPTFSRFFKYLYLFPVFLSLQLLCAPILMPQLTPTNPKILILNTAVPGVVVRGSMSRGNPIPDYVRNITSLKLARGGQIKLAGMPEAAIRYADHAMKYASQAKDPFAWFMKLCLDYVKQNSLKVNWVYVDELILKYRVPRDAKRLLEPPVNTKQLQVRSHGVNKPIFVAPTGPGPELVKAKQDQEVAIKNASTIRLQQFQFKKWIAQYATATGEHQHALQHMIMNLDAIDPVLKEPYCCQKENCLQVQPLGVNKPSAVPEINTQEILQRESVYQRILDKPPVIPEPQPQQLDCPFDENEVPSEEKVKQVITFATKRF